MDSDTPRYRAELSVGRASGERPVVATKACPSVACTRWMGARRSRLWLVNGRGAAEGDASRAPHLSRFRLNATTAPFRRGIFQRSGQRNVPIESHDVNSKFKRSYLNKSLQLAAS